MRRALLEFGWAGTTGLVGWAGTTGGVVAQVCLFVLIAMAVFIAVSHVYQVLTSKEGET